MKRAFVNLSAKHADRPAADKQLQNDAPLQDRIVAVLRSIHDPEIPVNIYDLGLIYKLDIQGRDVAIDMTLTTPHCPVADAMPAQVQSAVQALDGVDNVDVRLTWDPPWTPEKLSDEVKLTLGLL
jgi:FeS assembly SUF system protein